MKETRAMGAKEKVVRDNIETKKELGQSHKRLIERVGRFNSFLLQLAARLISTVPAKIGKEIKEGLKLTGEFWNLDRIVIVKMSEDGKETSIVYSYLASGISHSPARGNMTTPWLMEKIRMGETLCLSNLPHNLPEEAAADKEYCNKERIKSCLVLPYRVGDSIKGGLIFSSFQDRYLWPDELVEQMHYLGEILASAIERKLAAENIAEMRRFEQLLSEISAKYINMPVDQIEDAARNDFGRMACLLDVDRCVLFRFGADEESWMVPAYAWEKTAWWPEKAVVKSMAEWKDERPEIIEDMRYLFEQWGRGEIYKVNNLDEETEDARRTKTLNILLDVMSAIMVPIKHAGQIAGAIGVGTTQTTRVWTDDIIPKLRLFGEVFINALGRKQSEESLRKLKEHIQADYTYLREEINIEHGFTEIVGKSDILKQILIKVKHVASADVTVLLLGETGTGKGLFARAIHDLSNRKERPFVQVNCAALSSGIIESEFFGHEKGAFTGAHVRKIGRFELADGSSLFLDEIGELSLDLQAKLLRVLQDGEFERVGGTATIKTNARIIAATNKDLRKEVDEGKFRQDLWYRLNVFPIQVPPLRERREDIPLFVNHFVEKHSKRMVKSFDRISNKAIEALQNYSWPGNIRELENLIERAVIASPQNRLEIEIPESRNLMVKKTRSLDDIEKEHILEVLEYKHWTIEGQNGAAKILGLNPSTLRLRMKKHGIVRPNLHAQN